MGYFKHEKYKVEQKESRKRDKENIVVNGPSRGIGVFLFQQEVSLITMVSSTIHSSLNLGLSFGEACQHFVITS